MTASDAIRWARRVRSERPPAALDEYLAGFEAFFNDYAGRVDYWRTRNPGYHESIASLARFYVPRGARVLEVGCGTGDLLASLEPSEGVGIDLSAPWWPARRSATPISSSATRRPSGSTCPAASSTTSSCPISWATSSTSGARSSACGPSRTPGRASSSTGTAASGSRSCISWRPSGSSTRCRCSTGPPWATSRTCCGSRASRRCALAGTSCCRSGSARSAAGPTASSRTCPSLRWFVWTNWVVARPIPRATPEPPSVTVVCPCRNEKGNIEQVVRRLPPLGSHTELIFVEGHSKDGTLEECRRVAAAHPELDIKVMVQSGKGKGDAVRLGFAHASGDMLMILDADLSVAPEDLPQFYEAMVSAAGEFVMGSRLVYTMDPKAMRFLNLARQPLLRPPAERPDRPADQGHALRHQGHLARGLRASRGRPRLLRRLRSVRRLRSDLRGGQAQPPDRGDPRPLPRAHLRRAEHQPLRRRVAAPAHVRAGGGAPLLRRMSDAATLARHRAAWQARPELRSVYREWFERLLAAAAARRPVVEIGSGPGFFKECAPSLVATDVVPGLSVDVRCDADVLPFRSDSVGAIVMVDTLHHLPRPLDFLSEAARVLKPGGRLAMVEPWITAPSWVLYRYFHHEECRLGVDVARPSTRTTRPPSRATPRSRTCSWPGSARPACRSTS